MTTDLAAYIASSTMINTHEHMAREKRWTQPDEKHDLLRDLFDNYVPADFHAAKVDEAAYKRLVDANDPDIEGRWAGVRDAWEAVKLTGYGEGVSLIARTLFGMDEITPEAVRQAQPRFEALTQPGKRLYLLRDVANLDHIQVDDFRFEVEPDESGPDFFLYDISMWTVACGHVDPADIARVTEVTVTDLASLGRAMEVVFERHGARAIAVKSQHAYNRTLLWRQRSDADARKSLDVVLREGKQAPEADRLCLGDWCLDQAARLCAEHDLPFKLHTGYHAGNGYSRMEHIRPTQLCDLLIKHPKTRWVLMHAAYPYGDELIAMAKHFPCVWLDLCWAWSIDPFSTAQFVRQFIHAVPANKLFAFGGDSFNPMATVGYAMQTRRWLARALQAEVDEGLVDEKAAIELARRFMVDNQRSCFRIDRAREAVRATLAGAGA